MIGVWVFSAFGWSQQNTDRAQFFETRIRPILANNCYSRHTGKKSGGLRVDSRVGLLAGCDSGPAIIPGRPDESLLIRAVSHMSAELQMPKGGEKLKDRQIADLRYWIQAMAAYWPDESGAKAPSSATGGSKFTIYPEQRKFWSFQPIRKPPLPAVANAAWVKDPIDRFILAKLEARALAPAPQGR